LPSGDKAATKRQPVEAGSASSIAFWGLAVASPRKIGPSASSDTFADRPNESTDTDSGGTGERATPDRDPSSEVHVEIEAFLKTPKP
jgi:hypothetical protein